MAFVAPASVGLFVGLALLALGCDRPEAEHVGREGPAPPAVETLVVAPEDVRDVIELVGQLDSAKSVVLKPEIAGIVAELHFEEGQPVKRGAALVSLRDAEQRARLRQAQAELALARAVYDRTRALARRNAESAAELDRARASHEIELARVELAEVELKRTRVRAPFDGVMGERMVSPGERVSPGSDRGPGGGGEPTGLARIDALDPLELVFTIPETVIALVKNGVRVSLRVAPFPGETFGGQVYFVASRVNATNRRMLVKARVPNPTHRLKPGLFAKLDVEVASSDGALMVPEDAVVYERAGTSIWRLDSAGVAERVPVELGIRKADRVEILSGLGPGDRIVTSGTHKVVPGRPVRSVAAPEAATEEGEAATEEVGL